MSFFEEIEAIFSSFPVFLELVGLFGVGFCLMRFLSHRFFWPAWVTPIFLIALLGLCLFIDDGWHLLQNSFGDSYARGSWDDIQLGVSSEFLWLMIKMKVVAAVVGTGVGMRVHSKFLG